jgi:hypothetical protein
MTWQRSSGVRAVLPFPVHSRNMHLFFLIPITAAAAAAALPVVPVEVMVDLSSPPAPFPHYWNSMFGSGHAALSLRPDWQAHLQQAVIDLGLGGVRYHGIFDDDMGPVVTGPVGARSYNFTLIDRSWDFQVRVPHTYTRARARIHARSSLRIQRGPFCKWLLPHAASTPLTHTIPPPHTHTHTHMHTHAHAHAHNHSAI